MDRRPGAPLRVVYLDHCAQLSGGELALARALTGLPEVEAHVILAEDGPLVDRLRAAGASVEVVPLRTAVRALSRERVRPRAATARAAVDLVAYAARIAGRLRRRRPDLVHANSLKAGLYGSLAARAARVPVIWHVRDRIAEDYMPAGAARAMRAAVRRLPNAVIANSRTTLACVEPLRRPSHVIPSPVDVTARVGSPERDGRPMHVGIVGRLAPWKGQHVFLDAFARAFPSGSERAVIVGAPLFGEEDYERRLEEQAARLGIAGRVRFAGFVHDVDAELGALDVLVHASVLPEPFGQVVVEGMAAGLAVVASDAGGPAETIRPGIDGLLTAPGDVGALAAALTRLAEDDALRESLRREGPLTAQRYAAPAIGALIMDAYRQLLAR